MSTKEQQESKEVTTEERLKNIFDYLHTDSTHELDLKRVYDLHYQICKDYQSKIAQLEKEKELLINDIDIFEDEKIELKKQLQSYKKGIRGLISYYEGDDIKIPSKKILPQLEQLLKDDMKYKKNDNDTRENVWIQKDAE